MKIRRFLSVFLLTLLLTGLFCVPQASAVEMPQVNAKAALLMDYESGRMLYGLNEKDTEYPASITKVMTALLTLEAVDQGVLTLDQPVTAPSLVNDMDPTGSSADIKEGEVLTVEQLLYCMMLVSANEAACILAETVSGSQDAFVALMNQRAQELGCTGTHFVNPNGLHDPNHYSTAWDIYLITREAMKNETFMKICGTAAYVVPATNKSEERELYTTNSLISNWRIMAISMTGLTASRPAPPRSPAIACCPPPSAAAAAWWRWCWAARAAAPRWKASPKPQSCTTGLITTSPCARWRLRTSCTASRWPCPSRRTP